MRSRGCCASSHASVPAGMGEGRRRFAHLQVRGGLGAPLSHRPTLQRFGNRGRRPSGAGGQDAPCGWSCCGLRPSFSGGIGLRRYPARSTLQRFPETGGLPLYPRRGLRPLHPAWGTGVLLWLAPSFSGGVGLACAVVPPAPPSDVCVVGDTPTPPAGTKGSLHPPLGRLRTALSPAWKQGGSQLYPRRGLRPLHPAWGTRGFVVACALLQRGVLAWPAPLSHLAHPPTFLETGGLPLHLPAGALGSLHLPLGDR